MPVSDRPFPWPWSALTARQRYDLRAMAELSGASVTAFVRDAILAHMPAKHRRLFPDLAATPWDHAEPARRVAEGDGHG